MRVEIDRPTRDALVAEIVHEARDAGEEFNLCVDEGHRWKARNSALEMTRMVETLDALHGWGAKHNEPRGFVVNFEMLETFAFEADYVFYVWFSGRVRSMEAVLIDTPKAAREGDDMYGNFTVLAQLQSRLRESIGELCAEIRASEPVEIMLDRASRDELRLDMVQRLVEAGNTVDAPFSAFADGEPGCVRAAALRAAELVPILDQIGWGEEAEGDRFVVKLPPGFGSWWLKEIDAYLAENPPETYINPENVAGVQRLRDVIGEEFGSFPAALTGGTAA